MKILIVDDEDLIRQICSVFLENSFKDLTLLEAVSGNLAIELLEKHDDIDLVISDYMMPDGDGEVLYRYVKEKKAQIPFFLISSNSLYHMNGFEKFPVDTVKERFLQKPISRSVFIKTVTELLNCSATLDEKYKKIRIYNFWKFNIAECNVYIKLSPEKFVKIINKGSSYTRADTNKYSDKKIDFLYIEEEDYNSFAVNMASTPFLKFKCKKGECIDTESVKTTHAMIHELVSSVGISSAVVESAEKISDKIVAFIRKNSKSVLDLLEQARDAKDFIYDHSYMTSIICCEIVSNMEWNTREIQNKLCMASLFHDLELTDSKLAMSCDLHPETVEALDSDIKATYLKHSVIMAEKVRAAPPFPSNVDTIILQHHENANGLGFPQQLSAKRVSPLVCTFIIAHDFVTLMYRLDFDTDKIKAEFENFCSNYQVGNYKAPIVAFGQKFDKYREE